MKGRIQRPSPEVGSGLPFPIIGRIKVGMKSERGYPQSVDYFIPSGKYASLFTKAYGEKPNTIQVIFPDDDPSKVCCERYEYRDDEGKLIAQGDGETFKVWNGKIYQEMKIEDYPQIMQQVTKRYPTRLSNRTGNGWQITLTLNVIIPCVKGVIGVWQFVTKGAASTVPNIRNVFDAMLERAHRCQGIIFDLNVQFAKSNKPGVTSRYPVVSLVPNESPENIAKIKQSQEQIDVLGLNEASHESTIDR